MVTVQPVAPDPPPMRMLPVELLPMLITPAPLASMDRASSVPEEVTERATPAAAAADLILRPVAEEAVEASMVRAGLVVPLAPTARALAEAEVTVKAAVPMVPVVVKERLLARSTPAMVPSRILAEVTAPVAMVVAKDPVPEPVTSPVRVMVWPQCWCRRRSRRSWKRQWSPGR